LRTVWIEPAAPWWKFWDTRWFVCRWSKELIIVGSMPMPVSIVVAVEHSKKSAEAALVEYLTYHAFIKCDRCKHIKEGSVWADGSGSAGCYVVGGDDSHYWSRYANPGEHLVCDQCMWSDPRYIKVYGRVGFVHGGC
jgi:hypothetical protein